jgi:IS5 family transposase
MSQKTFADIAWEGKERRTRREQFLSEMESVVPWKELEKLIHPVAPRAIPSEVGGRPAHPVSVMLRIYFCQNWYQLSDEGAEDTLYDSESVRRFCMGSASIEAIPDASSVARFRHLLDAHELQKKLFSRVNEILSKKGIVTKTGTIVDATIIHAPSSTKNETKTRDPEMSQTKKGNQWYFGMKCHIGVDERSGVVHSVTASTAREADITHIDSLLHGKEKVVLGDRGYESRKLAESLKQKGVRLLTQRRRRAGRDLSETQRKRNRRLSARRAHAEHPFHVMKCIFGYRKTRYRGLWKNFLNQVTLLLLANLYKLRLVFPPLR